MARLLMTNFAAVFLLLSPNGAHAADQANASMSWTSPQLASLQFTRDMKPIRFSEKDVALVFSDPRKKSEVEKILLDPQYRPGDSSNADFGLQTTITSPVSKKKVSETSRCYWNADPSGVAVKDVTVCSIEDDGGRVMVVAENRGTTLGASQFALYVLRMGGYSGFRIANDVPVGNESNEPHAIFVQLKSVSPVRSLIHF